MRNILVLLALMMLLPFALLSESSKEEIQPGEYIREGGSGFLTIKIGHNGKKTFSILSVGSNGHTCEIEDEVINNNNKAIIQESSSESNEPILPCVITFSLKSQKIQVTSEECGGYCGARAQIDGLYIKSAPGCKDSEIDSSRSQFKKLYDKKDYANARLQLEPILKNCAKTISWVKENWIRSDLSITQYKLGDWDGCLKTLQPFEEDIVKKDDDILLPPFERELYLPIIKAVRANFQLCSKAKNKH